MSQITLTAKQTEAYRAATSGQYQFVLYGGAVRGGKSFWLLITFIYLCARYPKSRWAIIRESLPTLRRTTLVTWSKLMEMGLKSHIASMDNQTYTVTFKNGSQILFMAEQYHEDKELTRFAGLEVNGFGADEINELQEKTFDKMFERAGSWIIPDQPRPLVLGTCNPAHNWVKHRIYDKYIQHSLPKSWKYIPAKITDNPHVPADYLLSLKTNLPPLKYQQFVEGDWEAKEVSNAFAIHFDLSRHALPAPIDTTKPLYLSIDFNLNPFGAIALQIWRDREGDHFHIVDEIEIENGSLQKMIDEIKVRYTSFLPTITITGDAMGNQRDIGQRDNASYYDQLQRGLNISPKQIKVLPNPKHENSRADVNYVLYHHTDLRIDPQCENTLRDLQNVECDAFGKIIKRDRKDLNQRADHLDCFRYAINTFMYDWIKEHQRKNNTNGIR